MSTRLKEEFHKYLTPNVRGLTPSATVAINDRSNVLRDQGRLEAKAIALEYGLKKAMGDDDHGLCAGHQIGRVVSPRCTGKTVDRGHADQVCALFAGQGFDGSRQIDQV